MAQQPLDADGSGRAPIIGVRLPRRIRQQVIELTAGRGESISDFVRGALERELARAGPPGGPDDDRR